MVEQDSTRAVVVAVADIGNSTIDDVKKQLLLVETEEGRSKQETQLGVIPKTGDADNKELVALLEHRSDLDELEVGSRKADDSSLLPEGLMTQQVYELGLLAVYSSPARKELSSTVYSSSKAL
jgi:hypothetical protein